MSEYKVGTFYELDGSTWKVSKLMSDGSVRSVKQVNGKGCKGNPRKHTPEQLQNAVSLMKAEESTPEVTQE